MKSENTAFAQVIELNGKFFGHNTDEGGYGLDRAWHDDIKHAIMWGYDREIPLDRISCPPAMREELMSAKLIKVKVTKIIEIIKSFLKMN